MILHNMVIDDKHDGSLDENYCIATFVVAPPVNYKAQANLTSILQKEAELTSGLMFLHLQLDFIKHV
jgi:hypothetical protein